MDNTKEFEDFDIEVNEVSQSNVEEVLEETPIETVSSEESVESENIVDSEPVDNSPTIEEEEQQPMESTNPNDLINTLLERIESLNQQNELLLKKFDGKIAEDEHKAQLFDKMYNELQNYKTDLYAKILKPFILSTITLLDDTHTFIGKLGENESALAEKYLRTMPDDLIDILESNGVVLYEDDVDKFNPRTQRVVKQVPTDNPDLDNFIVKRIRKGYSWNGVNLKPELVWIYKFKQEASAKNENQ
ncbi:nucleotide exchange factor GrpE [Prevotellamassilia timonensis]|uniref:nucleotide exchange factor GrpE n=1 Tax=Prevotellamassilia timonensis TaxID=1852370 RepID=UPI001F274DE3|nr:nucleotide exchange factor GrpE [Prevotellamassilia timonensis]MCF2635374.1 nucleotide exchange factor GrpE [Prevotellamassilia timonensis]